MFANEQNAKKDTDAGTRVVLAKNPMAAKLPNRFLLADAIFSRTLEE